VATKERKEHNAAEPQPNSHQKVTKSTKKNHPHGLFQNFVSSALFVVKKFSQQ
jgi:hypothetical protein